MLSLTQNILIVVATMVASLLFMVGLVQSQYKYNQAFQYSGADPVRHCTSRRLFTNKKEK
jgi:hypothetical protein